MNAANWLMVGGESLMMTSLLVGLVLVLRRPVARHFGPHLAYALWAVPLLRAILPPIPVTVVAPAAPPTETVMLLPLEPGGTAAVAAVPSLWSELIAQTVPLLAVAWLAGALVVIGWAARQHHRYRQCLLAEAVDLEPIGRIRLVMSAATPGPVSLGLLASQWFNPLAWMALRAFRFDQEAACDARVLAATRPDDGEASAARYARTIAKTAIGPRLILAAPMATSHHLKERLIMLSHHDQAGRARPWARLMLGVGGRLWFVVLPGSASRWGGRGSGNRPPFPRP